MYTTFKRTDLLYQDYNWEASANYDNAKIIDSKDHTTLNRTDGYEMLYFINSLALTWGWHDEPHSVGQRLEKLIREKVPSDIQTQSKIKAWIMKNYDQL
jgi:hypothetical protein